MLQSMHNRLVWLRQAAEARWVISLLLIEAWTTVAIEAMRKTDNCWSRNVHSGSIVTWIWLSAIRWVTRTAAFAISVCIWPWELSGFWDSGIAVALLVGQRTCDLQVAGSSPGCAPLRSGLGQATYTCVRLSPSSIIWYRPRNVISLAEKVTAGPGGK